VRRRVALESAIIGTVVLVADHFGFDDAVAVTVSGLLGWSLLHGPALIALQILLAAAISASVLATSNLIAACDGRLAFARRLLVHAQTGEVATGMSTELVPATIQELEMVLDELVVLRFEFEEREPDNPPGWRIVCNQIETLFRRARNGQTVDPTDCLDIIEACEQFRRYRVDRDGEDLYEELRHRIIDLCRRIPVPVRRRTLGEHLQALRIAEDYTQEDVAAACGVSAMTVSRWERDEQRVRPAHRRKLAGLFGGKPSDYEERP
jgi:DNA-binding XRE family transcriptional regulator